MKITKYGHACLLVEKDGARILIDPGSWSTVPEGIRVDAVLITHEHTDHVSVECLQSIACEAIYAPGSVVAMLREKEIEAVAISEGEEVEVKGVQVQVYGHDHAIIYGTTPPCTNHGFFIGGELFVPGDALSTVPSDVRILALPTAGPWMKLGEAIAYARNIRPEVVFPIHDALYTEKVQRTMIPRMCTQFLEDSGVEFKDMAEGDILEI